jgi:hypothetical protein
MDLSRACLIGRELYRYAFSLYPDAKLGGHVTVSRRTIKGLVPMRAPVDFSGHQEEYKKGFGIFISNATALISTR